MMTKLVFPGKSETPSLRLQKKRSIRILLPKVTLTDMNARILCLVLALSCADMAHRLLS